MSNRKFADIGIGLMLAGCTAAWSTWLITREQVGDVAGLLVAAAGGIAWPIVAYRFGNRWDRRRCEEGNRL